MSFGFSVCDFVAVINLANKIRKEFAEAPAQFKDISNEVRNLSFVVQDVEVDLSHIDLDHQQKIELQGIVENCRNILADIEKTIDRYSELQPSPDGTRRTRVARAWKRLKWEPDDIHHFRTRISSNVGLLNTFNARITRSNVTKLVEHQENQELQAILNWLSPVDYTTQHSDFISRRQPGTGQWVLDSPELQDWLMLPKQTLFCHGIPGAGKTIVASIVIEELYSRHGNSVDVGVAYIYCNYQRQDEQRSVHILASLLKQLVQANPSLLDGVRKVYNQHRVRGTRPHYDELSRLLHSASAHFGQIFIVIDALDECQILDGSRDRILDEIFAIQAEHNLRFLTTSRLIPDVSVRFDGKPSLEIYASKQDVMHYLRSHLERLPSFVARNPELQNEIISEITRTFGGMFLLAQLHLDSLIGKRSPKAMRSALKNLSTGLKTYDSAYNDAMGRIEGQVLDRKEMARQALSWITCAQRQLTTVELQNALAVEAGEPEFDKENIPDFADMVSVCAGLVTVDEQSGIIRLVHYTTREYFQRTWTRWFPNAPDEIATTCVTYVSFDSFRSGYCSTDQEFEARLREYPLYSYAAGNWGHHVRAQLMSDDEVVISLLEDIPKLNACVQGRFAQKQFAYHHEYCQRIPKQVTGLHFAAYFGLQSVVLRLIQHGNEADAKDSYGRTPLSWAADSGHEKVVRILLGKGVDPNSTDEERRTPLLWAAIKGHEEVIEYLLARGVDTESKDGESRTPLSWAAFKGHETIVQFLLERGADPDSKDKYGEAPLSWAALNGHTEVAQLLLEKGANPDSRDYTGRTPLSWAASSGCEEIVRLLLERDIDLDSRDSTDGTPLSWATYYGHEVVVEALEKGVAAMASAAFAKQKNSDSGIVPNFGNENKRRRTDGEEEAKSGLGCEPPRWRVCINGPSYMCPDPPSNSEGLIEQWESTVVRPPQNAMSRQPDHATRWLQPAS